MLWLGDDVRQNGFRSQERIESCAIMSMAPVAPDSEAAGSLDSMLHENMDRVLDTMLENEPCRRCACPPGLLAGLLEPEWRPATGDAPADSAWSPGPPGLCAINRQGSRPRPAAGLPSSEAG